MPAPAPPLEDSPARPATPSAPATGLTAAQVAEQRRAGATNAPVTPSAVPPWCRLDPLVGHGEGHQH